MSTICVCVYSHSAELLVYTGTQSRSVHNIDNNATIALYWEKKNSIYAQDAMKKTKISVLSLIYNFMSAIDNFLIGYDLLMILSTLTWWMHTKLYANFGRLENISRECWKHRQRWCENTTTWSCESIWITQVYKHWHHCINGYVYCIYSGSVDRPFMIMIQRVIRQREERTSSLQYEMIFWLNIACYYAIDLLNFYGKHRMQHNR